jgi:hypothetical protein
MALQYKQTIVKSGQPSAVSEKRSTVSGQRKAVSGQRKAASRQRSAVSRQWLGSPIPPLPPSGIYLSLLADR